MEINQAILNHFQRDEQDAVTALTDKLTEALQAVTLNALNWRTLRFVQAARHLYKPRSVVLSPIQYVELNRFFLEQYGKSLTNTALQKFRSSVEDYQAHLDMLGLKDFQLRQPVTLGHAFRKIFLCAL
jgi:glycerol-3-phosphate O-acyltransferase/dihydroxyacetone phosphate acyltransferase